MPPNPSLAALANLRSDPRLVAFGKYVPPLRLFGALGVARDEVAHSRLLATLLDPRAHAGAETMLRALLTRVADGADTPDVTAAVIRRLPAKWDRISVQRELYRVDVVADIREPNGLVVGIENKIDAGEGSEQLSRYQDFLRDRFPGRRALMLFLTPSGRLPLTAAPDHTVPCLPISYSDVLGAIQVARQTASNRDANTLELIAAHLREEIMGEPDEIRQAVRELWHDHSDALRFLLAHRPQLRDIRDAYEIGIRAVFPGLEFHYYPESRGELREIKFWVPDWPAKFPFTMMLHSDGHQVSARVLIFRDNFNQHAHNLKKWAAAANATCPDLIDEEFRALPGWSAWRRVFKEEDWPAEARIPATGSDDETARMAVERTLDLIARLRPYIG
ncbi:MAG: PD-(D/E)XK nuclease family protein [Planctomycetes bacterium]|nr:PD-(D/E)XK nuclease family protein [Planctomycetota bacterium]